MCSLNARDQTRSIAINCNHQVGSIAINWDQLQSFLSFAMTCIHLGSLGVSCIHLFALAITFIVRSISQSGPWYLQSHTFLFVGGKGNVYFYIPITIVHANVDLIPIHLLHYRKIRIVSTRKCPKIHFNYTYTVIEASLFITVKKYWYLENLPLLPYCTVRSLFPPE